MQPIETRLAAILHDQLKIETDQLALTKLQGDASYRIYYRLSLAPGRSMIVMKLPEGKSSASEEITNLKGKPTELPFVNIARFLKSKGLPVPEIFYQDQKEGLLFLEDFGDQTLEKWVEPLPTEGKKRWYQKAIDLLVLLQEEGMKGKCLAHKRSFDETLLNWEFDHFVEYGIEARCQIKVPEGDREKIRQEMRRLSARLTQLPQTFVHRDFQSRNLMVHKEELGLLDFQDALIGPLPYDVVALLRDSYLVLDRGLVFSLIDDYLKQKRGIERDRFLEMFDWMTIQRKLKDAGRFVYIDRVKKNPSFLKHIPSSLAYVREAFERQPELACLYGVLKKYVPEFR